MSCVRSCLPSTKNVASLLLVAMPFVPSSFLPLVDIKTGSYGLMGCPKSEVPRRSGRSRVRCEVPFMVLAARFPDGFIKPAGAVEIDVDLAVSPSECCAAAAQS